MLNSLRSYCYFQIWEGIFWGENFPCPGNSRETRNVSSIDASGDCFSAISTILLFLGPLSLPLPSPTSRTFHTTVAYRAHCSFPPFDSVESTLRHFHNFIPPGFSFQYCGLPSKNHRFLIRSQQLFPIFKDHGLSDTSRLENKTKMKATRLFWYYAPFIKRRSHFSVYPFIFLWLSCLWWYHITSDIHDSASIEEKKCSEPPTLISLTYLGSLTLWLEYAPPRGKPENQLLCSEIIHITVTFPTGDLLSSCSLPVSYIPPTILYNFP